MGTVSAVKVVTAEDAVEEPLPARVQEALGQLVGAAKEGLLALSVYWSCQDSSLNLSSMSSLARLLARWSSRRVSAFLCRRG
jgi:hypothetical protein